MFKRFQNGIQYDMKGYFKRINNKRKNFTLLRNMSRNPFCSQFDHFRIKPSDLRTSINIRVDMKN